MAKVNFEKLANDVQKAIKDGRDDDAVALLVDQGKAFGRQISEAMSGAFSVDENEYAMKFLGMFAVGAIKNLIESK